MKEQVLKSSLEAAQRLEELGLNKADLVVAALKAAAGKNEAVAIDPINAAGLFGWIFGTRALREVLLTKEGWELDRAENMESVYNRARNVRVLYQNVDQACSELPPKAISGKGNGARRLIDRQTPFLFEEMEVEHQRELNTEVWYLCVSTHGDEIRAELSRPGSIESNQFGEFLERIFLLDGKESDFTNRAVDGEDPELDVDVVVTRK